MVVVVVAVGVAVVVGVGVVVVVAVVVGVGVAVGVVVGVTIEEIKRQYALYFVGEDIDKLAVMCPKLVLRFSRDAIRELLERVEDET